MKNSRGFESALYYTRDHEWIKYQKSVAFVGVCAFKLTGIKQIQQIEFKQSSDLKKAGEILAIIHSAEYKIPVHMPVDGEVLGYNEELSDLPQDILLLQPELNVWLAFIFPSAPHERNGLLSPEQYQAANRPLF
jgi:glycine cleavage system H protein